MQKENNSYICLTDLQYTFNFFYCMIERSPRPDLLIQIQMGRQLRKVEKQEVNNNVNKQIKKCVYYSVPEYG
jgi:hypothetical protein